MKRKIITITICLVLLLSACGGKEEPTNSSYDTSQVGDKVSQTTYLEETPKVSESLVSQEPNVDPNEYTGYGKFGFDVANEIPLKEQDERYKSIGTIYDANKLYEFVDTNNRSIEEVALELGKIVMEDMKIDYEGKCFVVTEYKDLSANISREHITGDLILKDNQWLCQYKAKYKYTGDFGVFGAMPSDMEWIKSFGSDGSGEDHYFIIEKISDNDYIMRSFNKCKRHAIKEPEVSGSAVTEEPNIKNSMIYDEINNCVMLKGTLDIYYGGGYEKIDDSINVYNNTLINLDSSFLDEIIHSLKVKGWGKYTIRRLDNKKYYIKGSGIRSNINDPKEYEKIALDFLEDSGINKYLSNEQFDYEVVVKEEDTLVSYCYLLCEGKRTGSYIEMIFDSEKSCSTCIMYLYDSEIIETIKSVPFETAIKNAFYIFDGAKQPYDNYEYGIQNIEIIYKEGLPFYAFKAYGITTRTMCDGYALAIDVSKSKNIDIIQEKYNHFHE